MNKAATGLAVAGMAGAFTLGLYIHGPNDQQAKHSSTITHTTPTLTKQFQATPAGLCEQTLIDHNWHAGDLCDTLRGAPGFPATGANAFPQRNWDYDNKRNGWIRATDIRTVDTTDCWDTSATTDADYVLCWDGTIVMIDKR
jgi:hypothetical protein